MNLRKQSKQQYKPFRNLRLSIDKELLLQDSGRRLFPMNRCLFLAFFFVFAIALQAQQAASHAAADSYYAHKNAFGFFAAYSNDSSHMLLGNAENRKLLEFGGSYNRSLLLKRTFHWQYSVEFLPVVLESDPVLSVTYYQSTPYTVTYANPPEPTVQACHPESGSYVNIYPIAGGGTITYAGTDTVSCGRRWTMGQAFSPVGFQWNFRPRQKIQPFVAGHGGTMYSTHAIPVDTAGAFNFTFDFGAGLELFRTNTRSIRAEYRYHHISNHNTADTNPGIDNGVFQITYVFGR